ncbi:hypothetical protein MATL_G00258440 [Megalops atlanticus]|uniref:Uncharacterized protein n=1 Tax=Megalops atlanticus TaxID=7932 RepID=A0A9D3SVL2_MEGAT|nr:hypothetical protein MATL_G00258440 [Megalops atlanticus]
MLYKPLLPGDTSPHVGLPWTTAGGFCRSPKTISGTEPLESVWLIRGGPGEISNLPSAGDKAKDDSSGCRGLLLAADFGGRAQQRQAGPESSGPRLATTPKRISGAFVPGSPGLRGM